MAARALRRLAQQLAAAEAARGGAQQLASGRQLQHALPRLLSAWLPARPFAAQLSELESNGEVRRVPPCATFAMRTSLVGREAHALQTSATATGSHAGCGRAGPPGAERRPVAGQLAHRASA